MVFEIENAKEMQNRILEAERETYIKNRFDHQMKLITQAMAEGKNCIVWRLGNEAESTIKIHNLWSKQLDGIFRKQFEDAGYTIQGMMIYW